MISYLKKKDSVKSNVIIFLVALNELGRLGLSEIRIKMKNNRNARIDNEEATIALLTYFSELGSSPDSVAVDYEFIEQLLISAGNGVILITCFFGYHTF